MWAVCSCFGDCDARFTTLGTGLQDFLCFQRCMRGVRFSNRQMLAEERKKRLKLACSPVVVVDQCQKTLVDHFGHACARCTNVAKTRLVPLAQKTSKDQNEHAVSS